VIKAYPQLRSSYSSRGNTAIVSDPLVLIGSYSSVPRAGPRALIRNERLSQTPKLEGSSDTKPMPIEVLGTVVQDRQIGEASPMAMPTALASLLRAITHPSLLERRRRTCRVVSAERQRLGSPTLQSELF
jgi:hypothetical protein